MPDQATKKSFSKESGKARRCGYTFFAGYMSFADVCTQGIVCFDPDPFGPVLVIFCATSLHKAGDFYLKGLPTMANGTVKWFNETKGFGFIQPAGGSKDVFVHISAVERAGLRSLADGQAVTFDIENDRNGRESAINLALA